MCETCKQILSEGLDLCVRARTLDAQVRSVSALDASSCPEEWKASGRFDQFVARNNIEHPERPLSTRCATPALWVQDQYDKDLHEWERKARHHLTQGCNS